MALRLETMLLVIRPADECRRWRAALARDAVPALYMPLMYTRRAPLSAGLREALRFAATADRHILVSRAAVRAALQSTVTLQHCLAIGAATAAVLRDAGIAAQTAEGEDSEALLGLPALRQTGQRIAIWCAAGGRQLLIDSLRARGNEVRAIHAYQRVALAPSARSLAALAAHRGALAITATSVALLERWHAVCPRRWRRGTIIAASARIADRAIELGFANIVQSRGASASALIDAWRSLAPFHAAR